MRARQGGGNAPGAFPLALRPERTDSNPAGKAPSAFAPRAEIHDAVAHSVRAVKGSLRPSALDRPSRRREAVKAAAGAEGKP